VDARLATLRYLRELVLGARGNLATLRPYRVARELSPGGERAAAAALAAFFRELVRCGYIVAVKRTARGRLYGLRRGSWLWRALLEREPREVLEELEAECKKEGRG
jgi:hypothetical protein